LALPISNLTNDPPDSDCRHISFQKLQYSLDFAAFLVKSGFPPTATDRCGVEGEGAKKGRVHIKSKALYDVYALLYK